MKVMPGQAIKHGGRGGCAGSIFILSQETFDFWKWRNPNIDIGPNKFVFEWDNKRSKKFQQRITDGTTNRN